MQTVFHKMNRWLLPVIVILFVLEVMTLPLVVGVTYSAKNTTPDHVLTYTKGKLTWDSATDIDKNGVAEMDLFDAVYNNVEAGNGDNLVAPGCEGTNTIQLKNNVSGSVKYTAVLYWIRSTDQLPVEVSLADDTDFTDTLVYQLPKGVEKDQVIRAVRGYLKGKTIQDFDINWLWKFFEDEEQDLVDTGLGDKAALREADDLTVGIYIVVEDNNSYYTPSIPQTGDTSRIELFAVLLVVSGALLAFLLIERRREKKCESSDAQCE